MPVVDHFDDQNRSLECGPARARWQQRLRAEASHVDLIAGSLAIVLLARRGGQATPGSAFDNLSETEQREVTYLAHAALTSLDVPRRKVARERGIASGLEEFRRSIGQRELDLKTAYQLRRIFTGVLNAYDCALQNLTPITDAEVERMLGVEALPETSAVRRIVETAPQSEGGVQ